MSTSKILGKAELDNNAINELIKDNNTKEKVSSNLIKSFIKDYQKSYHKGIEMYGVWWKVFQLSIWSIILIFLLTASIIFIIFLPKIDFLNWMLR